MFRFLFFVVVGIVLAVVALGYLGVLNVDAVVELVRGVLLK